ncbi:MAG: metallophosphoesterase family protein [Candidatus Roizmanbacteria bacterium]
MTQETIHQIDIPTEHEISVPTGIYGICSDTHFGSSRTDRVALGAFATSCRDRGVSTLIHGGDVIDSRAIGRDYGGDEKAYWQQVLHDMAIFTEQGLNIIAVQGNHEQSLAQMHPRLYSELVHNVPALSIVEANRAEINVGQARILVDHFANQADDQACLTVGGHTHMPGIRDRYINPGGFQIHHTEQLRTGGYILNQGGAMERIGMETEDDEKLLQYLRDAGFYPNGLSVDPLSFQGKFLEKVLERARQVDKDAVVWLTGSRAIGNPLPGLGHMNPWYEMDASNLDRVAVRGCKPKSPHIGQISDLDIEMTSETLTKAQLDEIIRITCSEPFHDPTIRIEANCYRPQELEDYFNLTNGVSGHNYGLYRMLLAPRATLQHDDHSTRVVGQLGRQAASYIHRHHPGRPHENPTVRAALGYLDFKNQVKYPLRRGAEVDVQVVVGTPLHDYIRAKVIDKGGIADPPYARKGMQSHRVNFPNQQAFGGETCSDAEHIISGPLTGYDRSIHFGQMLSAFASDSIARSTGAEYNPFTFQVTGPYWDRKGLTQDEIRAQIDVNVADVVSNLESTGLRGTVYRDDSSESTIRLHSLIDKLFRLGLIQHDENGLALRIGSTLLMLGAPSTQSRTLADTANKYVENSAILPIYPTSSPKGDGPPGFKYSIYERGKPVYPTFSLLGNIPTGGRKYTIETGENVATQLALGATIAIKSANPNAEVETVVHRLVMDPEEGKRMSRRTSFPIPTLDSIKDICSELTRGSAAAKANPQIEAAMIRLGTLSHFRTDDNMRFNKVQFQRGLRAINRLRLMRRQLGLGGSAITAKDPNDISPGFRRHLKTASLGKAVAEFEKSVDIIHIAQDNTDIAISADQFHDLASMGYMLAGTVFLDALS